MHMAEEAMCDKEKGEVAWGGTVGDHKEGNVAGLALDDESESGAVLYDREEMILGALPSSPTVTEQVTLRTAVTWQLRTSEGNEARTPRRCCWNCGEVGHELSACTQPRNNARIAEMKEGNPSGSLQSMTLLSHDSIT